MAKINKSDFVGLLARRLHILPSETERLVNEFVKLIYEKLADGDSVSISGFGQFSVSHRAPRLGVDPRTLKKITIPELNTPKFRAGEAFKAAVKL